MINKRTFESLCSVFGVLLLISGIHGQDWKKIVPLQTTCEDLKVILRVDNCKIPVSEYKFPDMWLNITISKGDEKQGVALGTVTGVIVMFQNPIPLRDFEADLNNFKTNLKYFEILPDDDLPDSKVYQNKAKGIRLTVRTVEAENNGPEEKYVRDVTLYPPKFSMK